MKAYLNAKIPNILKAAFLAHLRQPRNLFSDHEGK